MGKHKSFRPSMAERLHLSLWEGIDSTTAAG